jgi:hypothetical protein
VAEVLNSAFITDVFQVGAEIQHALSPSLACSARSRCSGATPAAGLFSRYLCPNKLRGKEKKTPHFSFPGKLSCFLLPRGNHGIRLEVERI